MIQQIRPQGKQLDLFEAVFLNAYQSIGYGGGGGGGKSYAVVMLFWLLCWRYPGTKWALGREHLTKLKRTTLVSYFKFCSDYSIPKYYQGHFSDQKSNIKFPNGSEIVLVELKYKPSDPTCTFLGSYEFTGGAIDESNEVNAIVVDTLYSRIGRWKNEEYGINAFIIESFNPAKNHVYNRFYQPYRQGKLDKETIFIPTTVIDRLKHPEYFRNNLKLHKDDVGSEQGEYAKGLLGRTEAVQQRLLWGNFEYDSDPAIICPYEKIQLLTSNINAAKGEMAITADIAGRGSDLFVIFVWEGWHLIHVEVYEKSDGAQIVNAIKNLQVKYRVKSTRIVYDADGIGGGVTGHIPGSIEFMNGSKPVPVEESGKNFKDLRSQCWYYTMEDIKDQELYIACDMPHGDDYVFQELDQFRHINHDKDEPIRITPKNLIKENIGRSPDYGDAIMMRKLLDLIEDVGNWVGAG